MNKRWSATLAILALSVAGSALAEVRVNVDSDGAVKVLSVKANRSRNLIWTRFTPAPDQELLNPFGD